MKRSLHLSIIISLACDVTMQALAMVRDFDVSREAELVENKLLILRVEFSICKKKTRSHSCDVGSGKWHLFC